MTADVFFGAYGVATVNSPAIDQLAANGATMENYWAVSPICSPSRGVLMTGRYPQRNGLVGLTHHGFCLHSDEKHAAQLFSEAGWDTHLFSFQHEAEDNQWQRLGFGEYHCRQNNEARYPLMFQAAPVVAKHFADFATTRKDQSTPFFAQIGFNETHTPYHFGGARPDRRKGVTVPDRIQRDRTSEDHFADLQGAIAQADEGVAIIIDALKKNGLLDNTIVVFYSDHGIEAARDKWTLYDPGLEIPCIYHWPAGGFQPGYRIANDVSSIHFLPTILDLCGIPLPDNLDGTSYANALRGKALTIDNTFYGIYYNGACRCVRKDGFKLIRNFGPEPYQATPPVKMGRNSNQARQPVELYNLSNDPLECCNLASEKRYSSTLQELNQRLCQWLKDVNDPVILVMDPTDQGTP